MHLRSNPPSRRLAYLILLLLTSIGLSIGSRIPSCAAAENPSARPGLDRLDRIVVKFREGTGVRLRGSSLTSLEASIDVGPVRAWLVSHPGVEVARHFSRSEEDLDAARLSGERASGWKLADLNLYYRFLLPAGVRSASSVDRILAEVRALPLVETAFVEPVAQPAVSEAALAPPQAPPAPATPDFTGLQGYLGASPSGVNAQAVWGNPGGRGATVRLIDIEGAWLWSHEDLKVPFFTGGTPIDDLSWRNHGTAVMGEMVGRNNGAGVTGIASDLSVGGVSIGTMGVADAIDMAAAHESVGDLFLIELHAPGPNANGSGQFGYVPMEFWIDNFDAIRTAVANGRICIEAGGNGEQNLDDPVYQGLFDRNVRNSGAILVGAGTPTGLDAEWFTNYGSRLDLNGWGDSVTSTGYGDLQGGQETQWYTAGFSGTSSASPIIAGSVASLQGMSKAHWGISLNGPLAAQILFDTGTPWNGSKRIGNRPNLVAALSTLLQGIGTISGTVRDAVTNQPIAGAQVLLVERDVLVLTDGQGGYRIPVESGTYTLRASEFFHVTADQSVTVGAGENAVRDFALAPAPTGYLAGTAVDVQGATLPNVTVRILNTPIPPTQTDGSGSYTIVGIPVASGYDAIYGLLPAHGAAWQSFAIASGVGTIGNAILPDAETFEQGNGAYTGDYPWQWGTPSNVGPNGAFSGTKCWGTNLTGNYPDNTTAYLTSHVIDPTGLPTLYLSFTHYFDTESGFDGGNVQVNDGSGWVTVVPVGGYPMSFLAGLGNEDGWSGFSGGWQPAFFDLSAYRNSHLQIRFHFGSDGGVNGPGWYIDDVSIFVGSTILAGVEPGSPAGPGLFPATPNPFSDGTEIRYRLPAGGKAGRLRVVDAAGRVVREMDDRGSSAADVRTVRWDGRDQAGHAVPAGVYYSILEADGKLIGRRAIVRLR